MFQPVNNMAIVSINIDWENCLISTRLFQIPIENSPQPSPFFVTSYRSGPYFHKSLVYNEIKS